MVKNVVVKNVLFKLIHAPVVLTTSLCHCLWLSWFQRCVAGTSSTGRTWVSSPQLQEGESASTCRMLCMLTPFLLLPLWNSGTVSKCLASTSLMVAAWCQCRCIPERVLAEGDRASRCNWWEMSVVLLVSSYAFLRCSTIVLKLLIVIPTTISLMSSWDRVFFGRRCLLPCTLGTSPFVFRDLTRFFILFSP